VLREGFRGCDGAFINIDGFNTGEKTEMYWAIRSYEIAIEPFPTWLSKIADSTSAGPPH